MTSKRTILSEPLANHLQVSGLVQKILDDFNIVSIGDLCSLNLEVVQDAQGVGTKKVKTLRLLIEQAKCFSHLDPTERSSTRMPSVVKDVGVESMLLYLPNFLKEGFRRLQIDTVEKLLCIELSDMQTLPSWGEKKLNAALALRTLYATVLRSNSVDGQSLVGNVVPFEVMPDPALATFSIAEFTQQRDLPALKGKAVQEAYDLRLFFERCIPDIKQIELTSQIDWRDVPLLVNCRVQNFLDKHQLRRLCDVVHLATYGSIASPEGEPCTSVFEESNFGELSLANLRNEISQLKAIGLGQYRAITICDINEIDCPTVNWQDIPLRVSVRIKKFLISNKIETIEEVHRMALRSQVYSHKEKRWVPLQDFLNFSGHSLIALRLELGSLALHGIERYRFGKEGAPSRLREVVRQALTSITPRQAKMIAARSMGMTLHETAKSFGVTRERIRQIEASAYHSLSNFRAIAQDFFDREIEAIEDDLFHSSKQIQAILQLDEEWQVVFLTKLLGNGWEIYIDGTLSRIPVRLVRSLRDVARKFPRYDNGFPLDQLTTIADIIATEKLYELGTDVNLQELMQFSKVPISRNSLVILLGNDWPVTCSGSPLVGAGVDGSRYEAIDTGGLILNPGELAGFSKDSSERLPNDQYSKKGEINERASEILDIMQAAEGAVDVNYIIERSTRKWHQVKLVSNYLSRLYEVLYNGRGRYLHIDKIGLTVMEVQEIAEWGARLLERENRAIDTNELLELFGVSEFLQKIQNSHQLVSIISKHVDVRRLTNNLQLAHRKSFGGSDSD